MKNINDFDFSLHDDGCDEFLRKYIFVCVCVCVCVLYILVPFTWILQV
jgi:hypothetical protein